MGSNFSIAMGETRGKDDKKDMAPSDPEGGQTYFPFPFKFNPFRVVLPQILFTFIPPVLPGAIQGLIPSGSSFGIRKSHS